MNFLLPIIKSTVIFKRAFLIKIYLYSSNAIILNCFDLLKLSWFTSSADKLLNCFKGCLFRLHYSTSHSTMVQYTVTCSHSRHFSFLTISTNYKAVFPLYLLILLFYCMEYIKLAMWLHFNARLYFGEYNCSDCSLRSGQAAFTL